jgi:hypothetical protein
MNPSAGVSIWMLVRPKTGPGPGRHALNPSLEVNPAWLLSSPPPPHEIVVDLGAQRSICGFTALPRQDADNGAIAGYAVYVTDDASVAAGTGLSAWGAPVASGQFPTGRQAKHADFSTDVTGRYVMLRALSSRAGDPWTTLGELTVDAR